MGCTMQFETVPFFVLVVHVCAKFHYGLHQTVNRLRVASS
jgi:hypothetical protein